VSAEQVLQKITKHYLKSRDFNGITIAELLEELETEWFTLRTLLKTLVAEELVSVIDHDTDVNPNIYRLPLEPKESQLRKLDGDNVPIGCLYPRTKHLTQVIDRSSYDGKPYLLELALGEPQLAYRSFDLSILEFYRNDPRYYYTNDDVRGTINVRDAYFESEGMADSDQVLLSSFGFSYDDDLNRAVAVFLRYLADLSPEHQRIWKAKEIGGSYKLHPDYFRNTVYGEWGECVPICNAFLKEVRLINQMTSAMERPPLFKEDFGEYGDDKPRKFGFLIRPTLEEFNNFVLLFDRMLSDNIDKKFFQNDVPYEREEERRDGKIVVHQKGTLQILDEWIRKWFTPYGNDWEPWERAMKSFRDLRKLRQKPAHSIDEDVFDQSYFRQQRELLIDVYNGVRTLRMLLENHPRVRESGIEVPDWLREGRIWTI